MKQRDRQRDIELTSLSELTIFTIPKPFSGTVATLQRNALSSWAYLEPRVNILIMGQGNGVGDAAEAIGADHVPDVETNEFGTPTLDSAFGQARKLASTRFLCYLNTDIILPKDFFNMFSLLPAGDFLLVGRRWNLDVNELLDFSTEATYDRLFRDLFSSASPHPQSGSDYFLFPRNIDWEMPPFAVGRPGWDNWLIYRARSQGIPVIDASETLKVIHQNHDYSHVPKRLGDGWEGPEGDQNRRLAGGWDKTFTLHNATHVLKGGRMRRAAAAPYLKQRVVSLPALYPLLRPVGWLANRMLVAGHRLGGQIRALRSR